MNSLPQKVRVCVIGAGVAGLGAAQRLAEAGVKDFVLLEAEKRLGGRVCNVAHGVYFCSLKENGLYMCISCNYVITLNFHIYVDICISHNI